MHLALLCTFATLANIGARKLGTRLYTGTWHIPLSVLIGAGVELAVKYVLDKIGRVFRSRVDRRSIFDAFRCASFG
ncbi:hypothetical protein AWB74_03720 [Caballeronia arvi]|uniref:Uncharacterized protein n=1 Tax=Caballeronia arvi TaxID=1777135 RepID=A0A158JD70_9BURK|nr:hypothetical protein AWB74_03720 [Caballeronia arvi]